MSTVLQQLESIHGQIVWAIRNNLAAMTTAAGFWYPPDRVERIGGYQGDKLSRYLNRDYTQIYLLVEGAGEKVTEQTMHRSDYEFEVSILGARKFTRASENPYVGEDSIVTPALPAAGLLTLAMQPQEAARLRVILTNPSGLITGCQVALVGLDQLGGALNVTYDLVNGRDQVLGSTPPGRFFASLTSATVSGLTGTVQAGDLVEIQAQRGRAEVQDLMVRDIQASIVSNPQLVINQIAGVKNIELSDADRGLVTDGWALVHLLLRCKYTSVSYIP
jgi:hypothetical protein